MGRRLLFNPYFIYGYPKSIFWISIIRLRISINAFLDIHNSILGYPQVSRILDTQKWILGHPRIELWISNIQHDFWISINVFKAIQKLDQLANLHFHFTSVPRCTPITD